MYDFLFVITELFSLALTVEALQGKTCQKSLLSGGSWVSLSQDFRGKGSSLGIFLASGKLDTFCYMAVQTAPCYVQSF